MEQSYEELVQHVASLTEELNKTKAQVKSFVAQEDKDDDKQKDAFLKAQEDMKEKEKEATEYKDDIDKVKSAFKIAEDESDPEKKKEAMKKATEMKDELDKKTAKNAQEEEKPKEDVEKTAAYLTLENEIKKPIVNKILEATKMVAPQTIEAITKKLKTASLAEVKEMWAEKEPFVAALGLGNEANPNVPNMIPYAASSVFGDEGPAEVDFSKMDSEKLLSELYR